MSWSLFFALAAVVVSAAAFLRDDWERQRSQLNEALAMTFTDGRTDEVEPGHGSDLLRTYRPTVRVRGSGMRYDLRTYIWVDDVVADKWKDKQVRRDRFDNTSGEIGCELRILDRDVSRVWFGIGFNEPLPSWRPRRGVRSHYARANLDSGEIQVWQWYRFSRTRKWWERQQRVKRFAGGQRRPLGRWKRVRGDDTKPWHYPTWDGWST